MTYVKTKGTIATIITSIIFFITNMQVIILKCYFWKQSEIAFIPDDKYHSSVVNKLHFRINWLMQSSERDVYLEWTLRQWRMNIMWLRTEHQVSAKENITLMYNEYNVKAEWILRQYKVNTTAMQREHCIKTNEQYINAESMLRQNAVDITLNHREINGLEKHSRREYQ
jgi:hypothetical protein